MESLASQLSDELYISIKKITLMTGFMDQGLLLSLWIFLLSACLKPSKHKHKDPQFVFV